MEGWIALLAALVSLFCSFVAFESFWRDKRPSPLFFALSFFHLFVISFIEFYVSTFTWTPWLYQIYFVLWMVMIPLFAGSYLYHRFLSIYGHVAILYLLIYGGLLIWQVAERGVLEQNLYELGVTVGERAMPAEVLRLRDLLSGVGGLSLIGLALFQWRKSRSPGDLLLSLGGLCLLFNERMQAFDHPLLYAVLQLLTVLVLFQGFRILQEDALPIRQEKASLHQV